MSRIRDPQRLVELVADTMFRESTRANRARRAAAAREDSLTEPSTEAAKQAETE